FLHFSYIQKMKEELLHFIWQFQNFKQNELESFDGKQIQVLNSGQHNGDAGPDFLNARIKIDDTLWAGNVEIHVHQSDWQKHGHQKDPKYKNIILHVCYFMDTEIPELNAHVPTLVLNGIVQPSLLDKYKKLQQNKHWIPCARMITPEILKSQMPFYGFALCMERMEKRCAEISEIFKKSKSDWEATAYAMLARSFGSRANKFAFEQLMQSIPYKILIKHAGNMFQLEALLLGQANLLPKAANDSYVQKLIEEYRFLKKKYNLKAMKREAWNYSKLRPANFPDLKIVQMAHFIHQFPQLFSKFLALKNAIDFSKHTKIKASSYWDNHYRIDTASKVKREKTLSPSFLNLLIINAIVPLVFYYGKKNDNLEIKESALNLLEQIPAENNSIVKRWENLGYKAENALESQALIELKKEYCDKILCLKCRIGAKLFNS
ncbi:MAG: DUF2851 family protein, partial [Chitinophagales bacterium]